MCVIYLQKAWGIGQILRGRYEAQLCSLRGRFSCSGSKYEHDTLNVFVFLFIPYQHSLFEKQSPFATPPPHTHT